MMGNRVTSAVRICVSTMAVRRATKSGMGRLRDGGSEGRVPCASARRNARPAALSAAK